MTRSVRLLPVLLLMLAGCSSGPDDGFGDTIPPTQTATPASPTPTDAPTAAPTATQAPTPTRTPTVPPTPTDTPPTPTATPRPDPSVEVDDQVLEGGDTITVARVQSDAEGFVVIHEDDSGAPGPAIGHAAVDPGPTTDLVVTLDRTAVDGELLYAMLHADTGEIGAYEFPEADPPVLDPSGAPIAPSFTVTVLNPVIASVLVNDQVANPPDEVTIEAIVSAGSGWIVVHEQSEGQPGPAIGHTGVPDGISRLVPVQLDRPVVTGEVLYAMLHADTGRAGIYDFPEADPPVVDGEGQTIAPAFVVTAGEDTGQGDGATLDVRAQQAGSEAVLVKRVVATAPSWVTVFEDEGGSPGLELGHRRVPDGEFTDLSVTLPRPLVDGELLFVGLYTDAGSTEVFEVPDPDTVATDRDGAPVLKQVSVTSEVAAGNSLTAENQRAAESTAVAKAVSVDELALIALHEDGGDGPGPLLGVKSLTVGSYSDVQIPLSRALELDERVVFIVYADHGTVGAFDGAQTDTPLQNSEGGPMVAIVTVTQTGGGGPDTGGGPKALEIDNQPAGVQSVYVFAAVSDTPALVGVRASNAGGDGPAEVLGQYAIGAGTTRDFFVSIVRPTVEGETLYAGIYLDNNGNGLLELPSPDAVKLDETGEPIVVTFTCSGSSDPPQ